MGTINPFILSALWFLCLLVRQTQGNDDAFAANISSMDGNEAYRDFMDKLAQHNVDQYIDLPMIAVMGDTSSGKSSLLSMISMIELPSNARLTTRCPIRLQMRKGDERSATVKVIWKDDPPEGSNADFHAKEVTDSNWHDLTKFIAEAQAHIIRTQNKEVARDIVNVELTCPQCENLTLIDLPGFVRTHGKDESSTLPEDIQALLFEYLQNPRCVILAVLPANVDFHNSQIMAEARKVDPDTKRTIPVLTKPDLIDSGAEGSVRELLMGKKTQDFEMGFHMVKGRGQRSLNNQTTIEEGLEEEMRFFRNTEPWRDVEDKSLFGTKHLRVKLGELQMRLIRESFDSIVKEMQHQRDEAVQSRSRLGDIPLSLGEKRSLFRRVTDDFCRSIVPLAIGDEMIIGNSALLQKVSVGFHFAANRFRETLDGSRLADLSWDDWREIKLLIKNNRPYEFSPFPNSGMFRTILAQLVVDDWLGPAETLLDQSAGLLENATIAHINSINDLKSFPYFHQFLLSKSSELITLLKTESKIRLLAFIENELVPYSLAPELAGRISELRLSRLKEDILLHHCNQYNCDKQRVMKSFKVFESESLDDYMTHEVANALRVYGSVALTRFRDTSAMICIEATQKYGQRLNDIMSTVSDSDIDLFVVVPPEKQRVMRKCDRKIANLDGGIAAVKSLYWHP